MKKEETGKKGKAEPFIKANQPGISGAPMIIQKIFGPLVFGVDMPTADDIAKMGPKILGGIPAIGSLRRKRDIKVARDSLPTLIDVYAERKRR